MNEIIEPKCTHGNPEAICGECATSDFEMFQRIARPADTTTHVVPSMDDILDVLDRVNSDIMESIGEDDLGYTCMIGASVAGGLEVSFGDYPLWSTEDDTRTYDEEKDTWEPLEIAVRREMNQYLDMLKRIRV